MKPRSFIIYIILILYTFLFFVAIDPVDNLLVAMNIEWAL
jgi:hypothetical protein